MLLLVAYIGCLMRQCTYMAFCLLASVNMPAAANPECLVAAQLGPMHSMKIQTMAGQEDLQIDSSNHSNFTSQVLASYRESRSISTSFACSSKNPHNVLTVSQEPASTSWLSGLQHDDDAAAYMHIFCRM